MQQKIKQATDDVITYKFNVGMLGTFTIVGFSVTSIDLTITNEAFDDTSVGFTVSTPGIKGSFSADMVLTLSNGDIENKCVDFVVGAICVN